MFTACGSSLLVRRFASSTPKVDHVVEETVKTTVDAGKQLEERVARMLRKRGHINIKMNQRVKDSNGNWSEFDIVYGWPIRHYVECKNYSHSVKLEMVAKFKVILVYCVHFRKSFVYTIFLVLEDCLSPHQRILLAQQPLVLRVLMVLGWNDWRKQPFPLS